MSLQFNFSEEYLSQIPALQLLINLGFKYLSPEATLAERQGKAGNVLLEGILRDQLKQINRIQYRGSEYLFSEENIQSAIQKLKNIRYDGLLRTNELVYDMLTLGTTLEQTIEGDSKSFNLRYIDWRNPARNVFHVAAEFSVERTRSHETVRPDIVLFVNGIPLCVIECKAPSVELEQAVSQSIRNQNDDHIPRLFIYTQLLLAVNKNGALYATAGTSAEFWGGWTELRDKPEAVEFACNQAGDYGELFRGEFSAARGHFAALAQAGTRQVTAQDRAIYSLCRPERLLDLAFGFTVFDGGIKKVARYQQYFVIRSTLERVRTVGPDGKRTGGIVWHTQGSGKSLTMVMLARNLALESAISNPRIVLVTDRDDLDRQLGNTFAACGLDPSRANSGRHLLELVADKQAGIVTTLIHKFDKALNARKFRDESPDVFMLVDESHRSNYDSFAARMRQMFPNACYLGFTGTPLMKAEKNSFEKFGGLIEPHYSIGQAVADGAVVPLLYEGRHVEMEQNKAAIDLWFERHTQGLSVEQRADLKRKYARASMLNKAEQVIYTRAFDISEHYRTNWQGTGFKAQLVAPSKDAALQYHEYLKDIGYVTSEVIISGPDAREGYDEVDDEPTDAVQRFWQKMMTRFGSEEEYNKQIINQFKNGDAPEILIVVSKLLTGFDVPRNAVMYLCKDLKEHSLLQAIARVNRLYKGKRFGYIVDYVGLLGELDTALTMYDALEGFDEADLEGSITSVNDQIAKLPQHYSELWDLFKTVKNSRDEETYELLLADDALREDFYERLATYSRTLAVALSAESFVMQVEDGLLARYKGDLRQFQKLKASVKLRYAESIDYRDYEPKIKKLLDTHIQASEVIQLNPPVNIFDDAAFASVMEERGLASGKTPAARADAIAHATKKVITEKMREDPAFYEKFSKLIQEAIEAFRAKRISDLDYLSAVSDIRNRVVSRQHDDVPEGLRGNDEALAYYGVVRSLLAVDGAPAEQVDAASTDLALAIQSILRKHRKVQFWDDSDAQKQAMNEIDDYLFDHIRGERGIELDTVQMDALIEKSLQVARARWHE